MIEQVRTVKDLRATVKTWRTQGLRIAFVPTMGALHHGHLSLVEHALAHADRVVASIFVNPTQFAPNEDFSTYPRTEQDDCAKLESAGANLAYLPHPDEMYPPNASTRVRVDVLSEGLCGDVRPHFFEGVATVVTKLFMQVTPDIAVFGEKDYQQLLIIRRMVRDLSIPIDIVGAPIVREPDGLAMSSRNAYLSPNERAIAGKLNKILVQISNDLAAGKSVTGILDDGRQSLADAGFSPIDYLELRSAEDLTPLTALDRPARLFAAARVGKTRLIDNMPVA